MDALAGLLDGPRARGAFVLRSVLEPPWSLRIQDRSPLTVLALVEGEAWVTPEVGAARHLGPGDLALVRGADPYTVSDVPSTPPRVFVHPGQRCTDSRGRDVSAAMTLGVRTWGNRRDGSTVMITGIYERAGEISRRLLDALPPVAVLSATEWDHPLVGLLDEEVARDEPGQDAVLDRLLDLLLIAALRSWFSRAGDAVPAWYRALRDPVVGHALRLLHEDPAAPWTVASLATEVGLSRAALARHFTATVGEPPMTYLRTWRLALAADLLLAPDATLASVAPQVGYASGFALSVAFKRQYGLSPDQHRRQVQSASAAERPASHPAEVPAPLPSLPRPRTQMGLPPTGT